MTILFAATEMEPLAGTGGLATYTAALPAALRQRKHELSVVLPCYRGLADREGTRSTGVRIAIQMGPNRREAEILETQAPGGVQVFLIRADVYFDRPELYGEAGGVYDDNAERFIFFSRAVVELARRILPPPEIVHVHGWQTALVPVLLRERRLPFRTVLTVHDLAAQGSFWAYDFGLTGLPGEYFTERGVEYFGSVNLLKGGLLHADRVTTASERYSREIQTAGSGCGLEPVLRLQGHKVVGIQSGVDHEIWNPAGDPLLPAAFDADSLDGRDASREALLAALKLAPSPRGPVFTLRSPMNDSARLDLLFPLLDRLLPDDARFILLGDGGTAWERERVIATRRHAGRFAYLATWDDRLEHLAHAGADATLLLTFPSPDNEWVVRSMRYGTVPLARAVPGLHELFTDYDPSTGTGSGLLFFDFTSEALWDTMKRARVLFRDKPVWGELRRRCMAADFSWTATAARMEAVYRQALSRG